MRVLGDYMVYVNKASKILALVPMYLSSHRARQRQGEWYEAAVTLRGISQLHNLVGDDSLRRIGREIIPLVSRIETQVLTDLNMVCPESSIRAMPAFYARYHDGCGRLIVQQIGESKFVVEDDTPYPEALNAGLLEGVVREFGGAHVNITAVSAGDGKRRYTVTWR